MSDIVVPLADLRRAYEALKPEIDDRILDVTSSGNYILGENITAFEQAAAKHLGVKHTIAVASGTDALHLAIVAARIGQGHEVITTPFTFAATLEAIEYVGARPVLVDIDPDTFNIDANLIEDAITPQTRAILPVHLFGLPANMEQIMNIAERRGLLVIEDCAHSFGAHLNGTATGNFGLAGAFSFYPSKALSCFGDGGMVVTNDAKFNRRLLQLRNHGNDDAVEHVRLGFNSRLDEIHAAILRIKLPLLDDMNEKRRRIAKRYNATLAGTAAEIPQAGKDAHRIYNYYTICVADRDRVRQRLQRAGISSAIYYAKPLHKHMHFSVSCIYEALPQAENIAGRCLSLPIFPEMTDAEVEHVATTTANLIA